MERKEILKFVGAIIVLGIIAYFPCNVLATETNPNLQLLAIGIILTIVLGGYNMIKSLFGSAEVEELKNANRLKEREIKELANSTKELKEANKLKEQELELLKKQITEQYKIAKKQLKSRLEPFVSCQEEGKKIISGGGDQKRKELQKELSKIGNELKAVVTDIEKLLLLPQDNLNEAKDIADGCINLSNKIIQKVKVVNNDDITTKRIKLIDEWNELAERAKELIKKL